MAQTIVLTNQKGGVGKTTTSAALAAGLAKKEKRVLAIDLDPQGNLGFSFGLDIENGNTLFEALKGDVPIYDAIQRKSGIDFIRSNILLSGVAEVVKSEKRELLLKNLVGVQKPRRARYVAAIALVRPGHEPIIRRGTCEGEILTERRGTGGFGYDPLFLCETGETCAQITPETKNAISHRKRGIEAVLRALEEEK